MQASGSEPEAQDDIGGMLKPTPKAGVPLDTLRAARSAFPHGHLYLTLRDELGPIFSDQDFQHLYPNTGQPAWSPWRLALVIVLQFVEGHSDRSAADMVRSRLDWKYLLGLGLQDPGFHYSILSRFRSRLVRAHAEGQLLDSLLRICKGRGWLPEHGTIRTDSTHIQANVRQLCRSELVGETLRAALNALCRVVPNWLRSWIPDAWWSRYRCRTQGTERRHGGGADAQWARVSRIGQDGLALWQALHEHGPADVWSLPEVEVLRRCWLSEFMLENGQLVPRTRDNMPSASHRIDSPFDDEAHFGKKGHISWVGYKVHFTETCDADRPHLITLVQATRAAQPDMDRTEQVHRALADQGLLPATHLVDAAYVNASLIVRSQRVYGVELFGPVRRDSGWQKREGGYDIGQFDIDWETLTATCPQGQSSGTGFPSVYNGHPGVSFKFAREDCRACPASTLCVKDAKRNPRKIQVRLRDEHEAIRQTRRREGTDEWQQHYHRRAGIESTFSAAVRAFWLRRCRYRGLRRCQLQTLLVATAMNVTRIAAWLSGVPRGRTQVSRLAALRP